MTELLDRGLREPTPRLGGPWLTREVHLESRSPPHPQRSIRSVRPALAQAFLLWGIAAVGLAIRIRGFSTGGLWTSDAWVAMSSRVGIGTAWHMLANAPGFYLFERTWIQLNPGSTWWGQIPAFAMGVASIPAIFFLAKYFGLKRWTCLGAAFIVSISPICITYSTRYKEYSADFLLACALLALAEGVRRRPDLRHTLTLSTVSVLGFFISASILPILIGVWVALGLNALVTQWRIRFVVASTSAFFGCLVVDALLFRNFSPYLNQYWKGNFFDFRSPRFFVESLYSSVLNVFGGLFGISNGSSLERFLVFSALSAFLLVGVLRKGQMVSPALVLGAALLACAIGAIPLGTGRTDEVLYPALILLVAAGAQQLGGLEAELKLHSKWPQVALQVIGLIVVVSLLMVGLSTGNKYQNTDVRSLASELSHQKSVGDHVVVEALMRYSWAYYEDSPLKPVFGLNWMPGFTVISTQPRVFIVPSLPIEGGSDPTTWVRDVTKLKRVWLVEPSSLQKSVIYPALKQAGWRTAKVIDAAGCQALLLERTSSLS
jgi:hypothetical protein